MSPNDRHGNSPPRPALPREAVGLLRTADMAAANGMKQLSCELIRKALDLIYGDAAQDDAAPRNTPGGGTVRTLAVYSTSRRCTMSETTAP